MVTASVLNFFFVLFFVVHQTNKFFVQNTTNKRAMSNENISIYNFFTCARLRTYRRNYQQTTKVTSAIKVHMLLYFFGSNTEYASFICCCYGFSLLSHFNRLMCVRTSIRICVCRRSLLYAEVSIHAVAIKL